MHEVGLILGTIILSITCFISVIACTFIIEALALKNSILKRENAILNLAIKDEDNEAKKDEEKNDNNLNNSPPALLKDDINNNINGEEGERNTNDKKETLIKESEKVEEKGEESNEKNDSFYIFKRFEISKLSKALPKPGYFFVVITIICYLYIGVTSNGIIAGNNLKDIIGKTFDTDMPEYSYYIIVLCLFVITIIIALNNIKHLKKFSMFIMVMRFVIIFLIMGCCFYSRAKFGIAKYKDIPKFDISNITVMIGNSLFVFMSHHSIPGMVENFTPQRRLIKLLIVGYIFSLLFIVLYSYIGVFAFGDPSLPCDKSSPFPIAIQSTFSSNFLGLAGVGYIINYYPILNVITSGM